MEGKNIDFAIIDEACKEAMDGVAEAVKELAIQLNPIMNSMAELIEQYNDANKPPQGRDAFRGFVEQKQKMNRRYRK
ncbi:MAG: hypothetical protein ACI4S2_12460 [Lachnospiraceae bacterium]